MSLAKGENEVNVQVVVRCRPLREKDCVSAVKITRQSNSEVLIHVNNTNNGTGKIFKFDQVYDWNCSQEVVYKGTISPIVNEVLNGYNCTVFAYGQTGTGKTFTMEGERVENDFEKNAGMIPRAVQQLFNSLDLASQERSVKLSILEIYNENLIDLLGPENANKKLRLFEEKIKSNKLNHSTSCTSVTTVQGLEEVPVRTLKDVFSALQKASTRRQCAETQINHRSSRSHMITIISVSVKAHDDDGEEIWKIGKLHLVDLAGSENIKQSGARGQRACEAGSINQSLLTLGRVINHLVEGQVHVPYRESKLTRLLQDALGGRSKTVVIATISPSIGCVDETISTLEYSQRAKNIKNCPIVNVRSMSQAHVVKELTSENENLKRLLNASREQNGIYIPPDLNEHNEKERNDLKHRVQEISRELETVKCRERKKDLRINEVNDSFSSLANVLSAYIKDTQLTINNSNLNKVDLTEMINLQVNMDHIVESFTEAFGGNVRTVLSQQNKHFESCSNNTQKKVEHAISSLSMFSEQLKAFHKTLQRTMADSASTISSLHKSVEELMNQSRQYFTNIDQLVEEFCSQQMSHLNKPVAHPEVDWMQDTKSTLLALSDKEACKPLIASAEQTLKHTCVTCDDLDKQAKDKVEDQVMMLQKNLKESQKLFNLQIGKLSEGLEQVSQMMCDQLKTNHVQRNVYLEGSIGELKRHSESILNSNSDNVKRVILKIDTALATSEAHRAEARSNITEFELKFKENSNNGFNNVCNIFDNVRSSSSLIQQHSKSLISNSQNELDASYGTINNVGGSLHEISSSMAEALEVVRVKADDACRLLPQQFKKNNSTLLSKITEAQQRTNVQKTFELVKHIEANLYTLGDRAFAVAGVGAHTAPIVVPTPDRPADPSTLKVQPEAVYTPGKDFTPLKKKRKLSPAVTETPAKRMKVMMTPSSGRRQLMHHQTA